MLSLASFGNVLFRHKISASGNVFTTTVGVIVQRFSNRGARPRAGGADGFLGGGRVDFMKDIFIFSRVVAGIKEQSHCNPCMS
jgi:hypothetical protein